MIQITLGKGYRGAGEPISEKILGVRKSGPLKVSPIKNASSGLARPPCTCLMLNRQLEFIHMQKKKKKYSKGLFLEQLNSFSEEELRLPEVDFIA